MATSLFGERPSVAAIRLSLPARLAGWFAELRLARRRRRAVGDLMALEAPLLEDLGLCRQDVLEAARRPLGFGDTLSRHRARRAALHRRA